MDTKYSGMSEGELLTEARSAIAELPSDVAGPFRAIVNDVETVTSIDLPVEHAQRVGPIFDALFARVSTTVWNGELDTDAATS